MGAFFERNIERRGRIARAVLGVALLISGLLLLRPAMWIAIPFLILGLFALYEAGRGWCLMRACGIKTRY